MEDFETWKNKMMARTICKLPQGAVMPSLPLDRSFYKQCDECLRWRMIGTQCKNPLTMMCDNDERYFYKGNGA